MAARRRPRIYQVPAIEYCTNTQHPALFIEPRLGKTFISVRSIGQKNDVDKVLINTPYETFNSWITELEAERYSEQDIVILEGTKDQRQKGLKRDAKWYIINSDGYKVLPEIINYPFSSMVFDESVMLKDPRTGRSKFFTKYFRNIPYRFILSGLPAPEKTLDYFQQLKFLNPVIFNVKNYYQFRSKYCYNYYQGDWRPTKEGKQFITQRLAEFCYFLTRKEVGLGGKKVYKQIKVKKSPRFESIERLMISDYIIEDKGNEIYSTEYAGVNFMLLHKLCAGYAGDTLVYKSKINALLDLLSSRELSGESVIIWSVFVNQIKSLAKLFEDKGFSFGVIFGQIPHKKRRFTEREFQKGNIQYLIGNPNCFKYGANLSIADHEIYVTSPLSRNVRYQSEDRPVNTAYNDNTYVYDIIIKNSIEEDICISHQRRESRNQLERRMIKRCQKTIY